MRFLIFALALTQSPAQFDVVSVKPSAPDDRNGLMMQTTPRGVRFTGVPLRMIIMTAYDVKAFQIAGGPDWVRSARWDVLAAAEGEGRLTLDQKRPMLQALMAERFGLKIHREKNEMPVYALTVDKKGARLATHAGPQSQVRNGNGSLTVKKIGMDWFSEWLSRKLGRVVIDGTQLGEEYDFSLTWSPEPGEGNPDYTGMPPGEPRPALLDTGGPSIFTALQEQLGLRLVSEKGPVEIIVIDRVEKPSAN